MSLIILSTLFINYSNIYNLYDILYFSRLKTDLKGEYLGKTEAKTREIFEQFEGGVIFVDEAYMYKMNDGYEKQILESFMKELTKKISCEEKKLFIVGLDF